MDERIIDKLDVVGAQLSEAVRLFFQQRDLIVIHTLVASAHQILVDLGSSKGVGSSVKNLRNLEKNEVKNFLRSINYPYNFFKHADHDPDQKINIGPLFQFTADLLMDGVMMLQEISGNLPVNARIYMTWFVSYYQEQFDNLPPDGEVANLQAQEFGRKSFSELANFIQYTEIVEDGA